MASVNLNVRDHHYDITPRPVELGGGWRLRLLVNGEEVGGGVFPAPACEPERGMRWWNNLKESERRDWARQTGNTGIAADAWAAYLTATAYEDAMAEASAWLASTHP